MFVKAIALLFSALHALFFPITGLLTVGTFTTVALDQIKDSHYNEAASTLVNPNATPEVRALMAWLHAQYGNYTLSGQYVSPYEDYTRARFRNEAGELDVRLTNEMRAIYDVNGGNLPAIIGLDYTGVEHPGQWDDWVTQLALQYHAMGGIVKFCWHWTVPQDVNQPRGDWSRWQSAIYPRDTNFDLRAALADKNSPSYQWLLHGIAEVAKQLQVLQDAGVPVLWRPLHEAAGGWFWWGVAGREAYLELYNLLFDQLTNEHGLNNLIWVWNGQDPSWYAGSDKADILADDPYPVGDITWLYALDPARATRFKYTRRADPGKMVAMTENDTIPNIDFMWGMNTKWLMFINWDRERLLKPDPDDQPWGHLPEFSGQYDCAKRVHRIYNDPRVMNLDKVGWQG